MGEGHLKSIRGMSWKDRLRRLHDEVYVVYLALRDPRTPWYARACAVIVVAYAASPIDLIPDFIPVLGYLDDLIIVPAGVYLVRKMISPEILDECREKAKARPAGGKGRWVAAGLIIVAWLLVLFFIVKVIWL
jgi:uncharacterized membrane protein YkvA (DUF1232 family)